MKKLFACLLSLMLILPGMAAYAEAETTALSKIDMTRWQYEPTDDVDLQDVIAALEALRDKNK